MFVGCERFKLGTPNGPGLPDLTDPTVMLRSTVGLQRRKEPAIDPQHLVPTCTSRCKNVVSWIGSGRFGQNALDIFGHLPNFGYSPNFPRYAHAYKLARPTHFRLATFNPIRCVWRVSRRTHHDPLHPVHGDRLCCRDHNEQISAVPTASKESVYEGSSKA